MTTPPPLSSDELERLQELRDVQQFADSRGWRLHILPQLEVFVTQAQEDLIGAKYANDQVRLRLLSRWEDRKTILDAVLDYIRKCEHDRKIIVEEIEQRRKENTETLDSVPVDAETYAQ